MKPEQLKVWQNALNKIFDRLPKMTRKQIERRMFVAFAYRELDIYDHINIFQEVCGELFYDNLYIEFADLRARNMRLEEKNTALSTNLLLSTQAHTAGLDVINEYAGRIQKYEDLCRWILTCADTYRQSGLMFLGMNSIEEIAKELLGEQNDLPTDSGIGS